MDPAPRDPEDYHKIWTTSGSSLLRERMMLYEFADEDKYRLGVSTKNHSLQIPFTGSANVIYNGSFFYFNKEKESIVKFDLATRDLRCLKIPHGRQMEKVCLMAAAMCPSYNALIHSLTPLLDTGQPTMRQRRKKFGLRFSDATLSGDERQHLCRPVRR